MLIVWGSFKGSKKYVPLPNFSIYYRWKIQKKTKKKHKNNKFKITALTWNEEFELPALSDSVSDIQDYFEYILKNMRQFLIILR